MPTVVYYLIETELLVGRSLGFTEIDRLIILTAFIIQEFKIASY